MFLTKNKIKARLNLFLTDDKVNSLYENKNIFFILGIGRSGTAFLTDLLNKDQNTIVFHEPIPEDFDEFVIAHKSSKSALDYIKKHRKKIVYSFLRNEIFNSYGEVNSVLRYHAGALKKTFATSKILHLVRDGRDVVRSFIARRHYTEGSTGHHCLLPCKQDPLFPKWKNLSRFEKICWLWVDANKYVAQHADNFIIFERLINDYSYFYKNLESYLNLNIGEMQWRRAISNPTNSTKSHLIPHWKNWNDSLTESFIKICGAQMQKFGYL